MRKIKQIASLVLTILLIASIAMLFSGCEDSYEKLPGYELPSSVYEKKFYNSEYGTIEIKEKSGDGLYGDCPKLYAYTEPIKNKELSNETIQSIEQKVDKDSNGNVTKRYQDYTFNDVYLKHYIKYNLSIDKDGKWILNVQYFDVYQGGSEGKLFDVNFKQK